MHNVTICMMGIKGVVLPKVKSVSKHYGESKY